MKWIDVLRHVRIVSLLVVMIELIRFLANVVEPVGAKVVSSEIYEGSSARGAGSPVVVISYEFFYQGKRRISSDLYQPKPPFVGRVAWTAEERVAAQRYVAERPAGATIRIEVSKYFPWMNRMINGDEASTTPNNRWSWWFTYFGVVPLYLVTVAGRNVLRSVRNRQSMSAR